ncbi:spore cortex-lytic enzyme precursor [Clostridium homopropionicum DSM 5847]|uniref:Spore cortex-lytic enzyme n=1 Tax=Clostridium homopropionicum DSM 5847 TaxID=1121318 RepID=A0A0L6ZCW2_9CLOT|nr:cell wall hydrolase [Clostridium homopropionicum]KOA20643.1 spore cortex-lytic enzyme precursor [Clostridium homopropionicum DSM 5847]SFF92460.1 LysM domain-containing protein [Clostridium homopropionicum]
MKIKNLKTLIATLSLSLFIATPASAATYRVVSNDSLYKIGVLFNTSVSSIKANNNLSSDIIQPGQVLQVPGITYTVKSGDTLFTIAKKYGISLYSLRKANNKWDDLIYPNNILTVPVKTSNTTSTSVGQTSPSKSVIPYSSSDLDLLARLIRAEAEGQPYNAKVAVAAVVVNRVQSSEFPNTISAVIYQRINGYYQFTPVKNGMINNTATAEDRQAALSALYGSDPTNGALFYFDDSATNQWLWSKPLAARIDRMVFVY